MKQHIKHYIIESLSVDQKALVAIFNQFHGHLYCTGYDPSLPEALLHLWILFRGDHRGKSQVDIIAMVIRQKFRHLGRFQGRSFPFPGFVRLDPGDGHGFRVPGFRQQVLLVRVQMTRQEGDGGPVTLSKPVRRTPNEVRRRGEAIHEHAEEL